MPESDEVSEFEPCAECHAAYGKHEDKSTFVRWDDLDREGPVSSHLLDALINQYTFEDPVCPVCGGAMEMTDSGSRSAPSKWRCASAAWGSDHKRDSLIGVREMGDSRVVRALTELRDLRAAVTEMKGSVSA